MLQKNMEGVMVAKEIAILTWNIQRGGSSARLSKIVENIERHNADIVVLSEFQNKPSGDSLRAAIAMQGLIHQACATAELRLNTVLIASRLKFDLVPMTDLEPCDSSRCMLARFEEFDLYGVYFAQSNAKLIRTGAYCGDPSAATCATESRRHYWRCIRRELRDVLNYRCLSCLVLFLLNKRLYVANVITEQFQ